MTASPSRRSRGGFDPEDPRLDQGDPALDALLAESGAGAFRFGALLAAAPRNHDPAPAGLPGPLAALVEDTRRLPADADPVRLARAAAFGQRHLGLLVCGLFCSSLPRLFLGAEGALVLRATGRMEHELDARINETGRFVLDIWAPDALSPEGCGLRSAVRVRLLHAAVRAHLADKLPRVPIRQGELLATLFAFGVAPIDALRRLGVQVHPRDVEDVWHLWRTVGAALGVDPGLLPDGAEEARRRLAVLEGRHAGPSPGGQALAARLLSRTEAHFALAPGLPRRLWTLFLGPDRVRDLGVEPGAPLQPWELAAVRGVGSRVGPALLDLGVRAKLGGQTPSFTLGA